MDSRRDLLKKIGLGAAVCAVGASAAAAAQRDTLTAIAAGGEASAPWWLLSPLRPGSSVGKGWSIADLSLIERGAAVLSLGHHDGRVARVHLCAHEGRPRGLAHTALLDMVLMDGGQGDRATPEDLGRVLLVIARRIRRNELRAEADIAPLARMLTHADRVALYGPEALLHGPETLT